MNVKEQLEIYLKRLLVGKGDKLLLEIFGFLENYVSTDDAINNEEGIAKLFLRSIESLDQNLELEKEVQNAIIRAFENIKTIEINKRNNSELMCMSLLNSLYNGDDEFKEMNNDDFMLLLDNLEKIRVIFKICNSNNNPLFPIGNLLFKLINSDNLLCELENANSNYIQALMLALQIFRKNEYPKELEEIMKMIEGKDLKFVEYLCDGCERIGNDNWKNNYEKNGLLVLYHKKKRKVLIRNNKRDYFNVEFDISIYNINKIEVEKNINNEPIAFFVEYELDDFKKVDLINELSYEDNMERISYILDIIYYHKNYNIIFESALLDVSGVIYPINPYGCNDSYVIFEGNAYSDGRKFVTDKLCKYGLLKISGNGLRYINLGILVKLNDIFQIPFKDFGLNNNSTMDDILVNWIEKCDNKQSCFNEFFKEYEHQIDYIYNRGDIYEKKYNGEFLIPGFFSEKIISNLNFDNKFSTLKLEECSYNHDKIKKETVITNSKGNILDDYEIEDIDGEFFDISTYTHNIIHGLIDEKKKKIYVGNQVRYYYNLINKIKKINSSLICTDVIKKIDENVICNFANKMDCFNLAFNELHPGLPMKSVARYRLLNHLMFLNLDENKFDKWIELIEKHQVVKYSIVKEKNPVKCPKGVLYVPKDRQRTQGTLKYIYDKYWNTASKRSAVDIYDQKITKNEGIYYSGGAKIEKIVLLFDNIQNGTSTKVTIDYYIGNKALSEHNKDRRMTFICDKEEVMVYDILSANKCEVEVYSIFAGDSGISEVENHVRTTYPSIHIKILKPMKKLTVKASKEDIDFIKAFYPDELSGKMREGCYLMIREYNQPKLNIMCQSLLEIERVVALFCMRVEL